MWASSHQPLKCQAVQRELQVTEECGRQDSSSLGKTTWIIYLISSGHTWKHTYKHHMNWLSGTYVFKIKHTQIHAHTQQKLMKNGHEFEREKGGIEYMGGCEGVEGKEKMI